MNQKHWTTFIILLLALTLPGLAQADDQKDFNQTVALNPGGRLTLKTYKGSIKLIPWNNARVEIVAKIVPGDDVSYEYAERSVEATRIEVRGSGSSVYIESDYDDVPCQRRTWRSLVFSAGCSKNLPYVHYEIRAPRELDLRVEDYKSDIELKGFEGRLSVKTYKGTVEADTLSGDLRIETYKGYARIDGVRGSLDIETYKGDVRIDSARIEDRSRLQTYKGNITLSLSESQRLDIRVGLGRRADFYSDFPLTMPMRSRGWNNIEGEINGGGPLLSIESYKGEIRLLKR